MRAAVLQNRRHSSPTLVGDECRPCVNYVDIGLKVTPPGGKLSGLLDELAYDYCNVNAFWGNQTKR